MSTRELHRIRDVPASCICRWEYIRRPGRWVRASLTYCCPWHWGRA